jgi:hypothetical protein
VAPSLAKVNAERPAPHLITRWALVVLSTAQLLLALPWLVGLNPLAVIGAEVDPSHLTRDGALGLLVAVAGLTVAARPRYGVPALMIASAGIVAQVVAGAIDEDRAHVHASFELTHLLALAVVALMAIIAGSRVPTLGEANRRPPLRSVKERGDP